jgi:hypothetical protein
MALQASIIAKLNLDNTVYDINLEIPSGTPTKDLPYTFSIDQEVAQGQPAVNLLTAVIGDTSHFYVAMAPPTSIYANIPQIKDLEVVVNDGGFDPETGKFTG